MFLFLIFACQKEAPQPSVEEVAVVEFEKLASAETPDCTLAGEAFSKIDATHLAPELKAKLDTAKATLDQKCAAPAAPAAVEAPPVEAPAESVVPAPATPAGESVSHG